MNQSNLVKFLNSGNYPEASVLLSSGEKIPKDLQDYALAQILDNLFRTEQYEIINHLVKDKTIETDIYEFDKFDKSVFQSLTRNLKTDENGLAFFKDFISKFDNLNDEVDTQTLLGYFLEKLTSIDLIKILVDAGCSVNFKNNAAENYIHQVVKNNQKRFELHENELYRLQKDYIAVLINEGVDVNGENIVQKTPLICAVEFNKAYFLSFLLEKGADPNHIDQNGNSAFFYAVAHQQNIEVYQMMRAFALPQFDIANRDKVTLLFEYIRMMYVSDNSISFLKKLMEDGADLYQPSIYYSKEITPLDLIAEKPASLLEAVLETGLVEINRIDNKGNTLLHKVCAQNVNYEADKAKEMYRKVKLLIEHGADIAATNDKDQTALMLASDDNLKIKTVELLMKNTQ
ncbi:MAG: ankyrin repeat domain-containing protein [Pedobacter sp.]|nr:MAG: ankyrin repeat domain-containing protein [Pedobacter sp.]